MNQLTARKVTTEEPASRRFIENLRAVPRHLSETLFRTGRPRSDRSRSTFVFGNVFLHLHPVRTHRWSLRWSATWGLGIALVSCLFVLVATGVLFVV